MRCLESGLDVHASSCLFVMTWSVSNSNCVVGGDGVGFGVVGAGVGSSVGGKDFALGSGIECFISERACSSDMSSSGMTCTGRAAAEVSEGRGST